jgi:hypothetical protein
VVSLHLETKVFDEKKHGKYPSVVPRIFENDGKGRNVTKSDSKSEYIEHFGSNDESIFKILIFFWF